MTLTAEATVSISDAEGAREGLIAALAETSGWSDIVREDCIEVRRGSEAKLRLLGAMIIKQEDYPVLAVVTFDATTAYISVTSDMGAVIMFGMKQKYQDACDAFAQQVAALIPTGS